MSPVGGELFVSSFTGMQQFMLQGEVSSAHGRGENGKIVEISL